MTWQNGLCVLSGNRPLNAEGFTLFDIAGGCDDGYDLVDDVDPARRQLSDAIVTGDIQELRPIDVALILNVHRDRVDGWRVDGYLRPLPRSGELPRFSVAELTTFVEQYPWCVVLDDLVSPFDAIYRRAHGTAQWLSTSQVARRAGIAVRTIQKACADGRIEHLRFPGGAIAIPSDAPLPSITPRPWLRRSKASTSAQRLGVTR